MSFFVPSFRGLVEIVAPQRLEDNQATDALNCRIESGDLVPYLMPAFECDTGATASGTHSIFKYAASRWVRWNTAVNAVRMPATDAYNRLYYTGDGYPKVTDANIIGATNGGAVAAHRRVGIPAPESLQWSVPQPDIPGQGGISSITYYVRTGSNHIAVVTCTDAHQMSNTDTVSFDFPGVNVAAAYQVKTLVATTFTPRGLVLTKRTFNFLVRADAPVDPADVVCNCTNHGFSSGDVVSFVFTNPSDTNGLNVAALNYVGNAWYTVDVIDVNRFVVVGLAATNSGEQRITGRALQMVVRVQEVSNPGNVSSASWDGSQVIVVHAPSVDSSNTYVSSTIAPRLQTTYYRLTYVNGYGQEGPPSLPIGPITILPGVTTTTLSWVLYGDTPGYTTARRGDTAPVAFGDLIAPTGWWVTTVRIYRLDSLGQWRYVGEAPIGNGTYLTQQFPDAKTDAQLGEVLSTTGYIDPPDTLTGLTTTPFGVCMGYVGKEVYASVPYQPHAWPLAYRVKSDYDIKGLVVTGAGVIVLTDGYPSLLIGLDPASWQMVKLEIPQACVSSRSVVDMGEWGLFASPDGLVAIQQNDAKVVTQTVFNRLQWQTRTPTAVFGAFYEGKYFGVASTGPFLFDPGTGDFVRLDFGYAVAALYTDLTTDTLYFLATDGRIYAFDRGASNLSMRWVSKTFQAPRPVALTAGQVVANGTVFATYYADGVAIHTQTVTDSRPFRLPRGRALDWQVEITGTQRVRQVAGALSVAELRQV